MSFEDWKANEGIGDFTKTIFTKTSEFAKSVWEGTKRESKETKESLGILNKMLQGKTVTDQEKKFLKAQSVDILKILPLVAIQGIPVPVPITPLLIVLGKKYGYDILPNSHKITQENMKPVLKFEEFINEREVSQEEREKLAKAGNAMPDGSLPIANVDDLKNAIKAHGRAKDVEKAKAHIMKRAKELGKEDLIPAEWKK